MNNERLKALLFYTLGLLDGQATKEADFYRNECIEFLRRLLPSSSLIPLKITQVDIGQQLVSCRDSDGKTYHLPFQEVKQWIPKREELVIDQPWIELDEVYRVYHVNEQEGVTFEKPHTPESLKWPNVHQYIENLGYVWLETDHHFSYLCHLQPYIYHSASKGKQN